MAFLLKRYIARKPTQPSVAGQLTNRIHCNSKHEALMNKLLVFDDAD